MYSDRKQCLSIGVCMRFKNGNSSAMIKYIFPLFPQNKRHHYIFYVVNFFIPSQEIEMKQKTAAIYF